MKSLSAPFLVATLAAAGLCGFAAEAGASTTDQLLCRKGLMAASRVYLAAGLKARRVCVENALDTSGATVASIQSCLSGSGGPIAQRRLDSLSKRVDRIVGSKCVGADLLSLRYPGPCDYEPGTGTFNRFRLGQCVTSLVGDKVKELIGGQFPTPSKLLDVNDVAGDGRGCVADVAKHAAKMVKRELRKRQLCLYKQDEGASPGVVDWDCRADIVPYGPGTGDRRTDRGIANAYKRTMFKVLDACYASDVAAIGYDACTDFGQDGFDAYDLRECIFSSHRAVVGDLLMVSFSDLPTCGDGLKEGGEACDDGNLVNSDTCPDNMATGGLCQTATCGDGHLWTGAEQCDDGVANSDTTADACRSSCALPRCGDDVIDSGEECDTGNDNSDTAADACRADCVLPVCGDGAIDTGEACDDSGESDVCNVDCTESLCGDGKINDSAGEVCDDIGESSACDADCTTTMCGDGTVNETAGEVCDDGDTADGNGCDSNCTPTGCGNGIVTLGEDCDDMGESSSCNADCSAVVCGDGVVNITANEQCDDAGESAACNSNCTPASCGDSIINTTAGEQCDDGFETATCSATCSLVACGDGSVDQAADEQCDDGNEVNGDGCDSNCTLTRCGNGIVTSGEACDDSNSSNADGCLSDCTLASCGDGFTRLGEEGCDDANAVNTDACLNTCVVASCGDDYVWEGVEQCDGSNDCADNCTLASCGDGEVQSATGEECDDGNDVDGDGCDSNCTITGCGNSIVTGSEDCDGQVLGDCGACSVACTCANECPGSGQLTILAGTGKVCASDSDCLAGICDPGTGRCLTVTRLESGTSGIAHGSDLNDGVFVRGLLDCGDSFPCGECDLVGIDPSPDYAGYCRCSNDTRQICDEKFAPDQDDCGGAICDCYFGPPLPFSAGGTPACITNRFSEDIFGTANVDLGAGSVHVKMRTQAFLGESTIRPCPYCDGDNVYLDGIRDGTCVGGRNDGESCDTFAVNSHFPAPGGGGSSLDCFPSVGKNVSGQGLRIVLDQTTGSREMWADAGQCVGGVCSDSPDRACSSDDDCSIACGFPYFGKSCMCRQCSGDTTMPCNSNAECQAVNAGSCNSLAGAGNYGPNGCEDNTCQDTGDGIRGECATGPDDAFCDGVVKANGKGFLQCATAADCDSSSIGVDGGQCTLLYRRSCFLDPIIAVGQPHPSTPVGVAVLCIPPTANAGINGVAGLPGPGRLVSQGAGVLYCDSDPSKTYTPGVGGCLDDDGPASLTSVVGIFSANCAGCHTGGTTSGGLGGLGQAGTAATALVNVASTCGAMLVVPGDADSSYLMEKLLPSPTCGDPMPPIGAALSDTDIDTVRSWINGGALSD